MTKTSKIIILLFILAFISFNLAIYLNIVFNNQLAQPATYINIVYLTEGLYNLTTGAGVVFLIAAIFLLIKNRD